MTNLRRQRRNEKKHRSVATGKQFSQWQAPPHSDAPREFRREERFVPAWDTDVRRWHGFALGARQTVAFRGKPEMWFTPYYYSNAPTVVA